MDSEGSTGEATKELSNLILDLEINELNKDFAAADKTAEGLIQYKPIETPVNKPIEPLAVPPLVTEDKQSKDVNDIVQDINMSDLDRLNQKFSEQTARNTQPDALSSTLQQQTPIKQETAEQFPPPPVQPKFDEKAFKESMARDRQSLLDATAHLAPVPDIFPKKEPSIADKTTTSQPVPMESKVVTKAAGVEEKKLPDWVTMPLKKKDEQSVTRKDAFESKTDTQVTVNQTNKPETASTQTVNTPVPSPQPKVTTPMALRPEKESQLKRAESSSGLTPFSEARVAEAPKPEPKENKPKRPLDNPNIANQIQSAIKGINDLSPALDVFNFKAYVNQGIKEGATMRGAPDITNMESLLKQLPFASLPKQQPTETDQPQQQTASEQPFTPFNFNLGSTIPNISERRTSTTLASNNDRSLIGINQNLNKISISLQQTQQTIVNSLNTLNNTAMEILRTIPAISMQQSQSSNTNFAGGNKSNITPTGSLNLIGNFRDRLGLTPRTFTSNTVFPGNNSIA